jgi:hypothetical protein
MYVLLGLSHTVDKVLRLFSSRWYWDSPTPSPACECVLLPFGGGGGGVLTLGGRGGGGANSDEGTDTVVLEVYTVFTFWFERKILPWAW